MKSYIITLAVLVLGFSAFASGEPNASKKVKVLNLEEVTQNIKYPKKSNEAGKEGYVLVYVEIDENGKVTNKTPLTCPCKGLMKSALNAVEDLKFEPATDAKGEAYKSGVRIPFKFELTLD